MSGSQLPKALDRAVDKICEKVFTGLPQTTLAHYTDKLGTVAAIVRCRYLWATECARAKGGERDLEVATPVMMEVLRGLAKEFPQRRRLLSDVREKYFERRISQIAKLYVACLTPHPDNSDMWASRFGGHGLGASIEFTALKETYGADDRGFGLYPVEYDLANLRRDVMDAMRRVLNAGRRFHDGAGVLGCLESGLYRVAALASARTKESHWAYQQEWRVTIVPHPGADIREPGTEECPRVNFWLRPDPDLLPGISRIIVGPNVRDPKAIDDLIQVLSECGYGAGAAPMPPIVRSACPPTSELQ